MLLSQLTIKAGRHGNTPPPITHDFLTGSRTITFEFCTFLSQKIHESTRLGNIHLHVAGQVGGEVRVSNTTSKEIDVWGWSYGVEGVATIALLVSLQSCSFQPSPSRHMYFSEGCIWRRGIHQREIFCATSCSLNSIIST